MTRGGLQLRMNGDSQGCFCGFPGPLNHPVRPPVFAGQRISPSSSHVEPHNLWFGFKRAVQDDVLSRLDDFKRGRICHQLPSAACPGGKKPLAPMRAAPCCRLIADAAASRLLRAFFRRRGMPTSPLGRLLPHNWAL